MPVLGHAVAGASTALWLARWPRSDVDRPRLLPACVALAYAPDVLTQVLAPWPEVRTAAHSLIVAPLLAAALTLPCSRWLRTSRAAAFAIAAGSLGLHDLLDVLQGSDRRPFWPLADFAPALDLLPTGLAAEVLLFGATLVLVWALSRRGGPAARLETGRAGLAVVAAWVLAALVTATLRETRETAFVAAQQAFGRGDPRATLDLLDSAARWPKTARAGRIETLRADSYQELGLSDRARSLYREAIRQDPHYFWPVAGLALLEAKAAGPVAARRASVAPLLSALERRFPDHPDLGATREEIARALAH